MLVTLVFFIFGDDGPDAEGSGCCKLRVFRMSQTIGEHEREMLLKFKCSSPIQDQVPWKQLLRSKDFLVLSFSWFLVYMYCEFSFAYSIIKFRYISTTGTTANRPVSGQSSFAICD